MVRKKLERYNFDQGLEEQRHLRHRDGPRVGEFVVVDPDLVEQSNLSRLLGARRSDAGEGPSGRPRSKVALARRVVPFLRA